MLPYLEKMMCSLRGGPLTALMAHPPALAFASKLFGGPPVMMDIDVAETRPVCSPYPVLTRAHNVHVYVHVLITP